MYIPGNASRETKQEGPWLPTGAGRVSARWQVLQTACSMSKEDEEEQEEKKKKKDLGRMRRSKRRRGEGEEKCHPVRGGEQDPSPDNC